MTAVESEALIETKPVILLRFAPVLIVAAAVLFSVTYRNSLLLTDPQMFSEDLFVYFNGDRLFGASALIAPYSGYLQLCCRLIAFVAGFFSARHTANLYAGFFLLTIFATSAVIYTSPIFTGWGKVMAALALVYSPTGSEVFFGMCYTQWIMAPVIALALYESPTTRGRTAALYFYFAMVGLSSPFVVLAAPFVFWKTFTERTRYAYILSAITVAVALIQLHGMLDRQAHNPAAGSMFERAFSATSIFYSWATGPIYPGAAIAINISVPILAAAIWYFWSNWKLAKRALIYFVAFGLIGLVAGCLHVGADLHANQFLFGARYFYPPVVLFVLTFIVVEQNSSRASVTLPIMAIVLGWIYSSYVVDMESHFTNRTWSETAACIKYGSNCVAGSNPGKTGSVRVPSESELKTMSKEDRLKFYSEERIP